MWLEDFDATVKLKKFTTGFLGFDRMLDIGHIPAGVIFELSGMPGLGKSTMSMALASALQKQTDPDKISIFCDLEHNFKRNPEIPRHAGVDFSRGLVYDSEYGENALDITLDLVRSGSVGFVVIDSVPKLMPEAIAVRDTGEQTMGKRAALLGDFIGKLEYAANKTDAVILLINQFRAKLGMGPSGYDTPGGFAIKFNAKMRVYMKKAQDFAIKRGASGDLQIGQRVQFKVEKNNLGRPFKTTTLEFLYDEQRGMLGFSHEGDVLVMGEEYEVITCQGKTFLFGETKIGVGFEAARETLFHDQVLMKDIVTAVVEKARGEGERWAIETPIVEYMEKNNETKSSS